MTKQTSANQYQELVLPGVVYFGVGLVIGAAIGLIALPFGNFWGLAFFTLTIVGWFTAGILSSKRIRISSETLIVGPANIPRNLLGVAVSIPKQEATLEQGRKLNALSFVSFQFGVSTLVKVELRDPSDKTPYWLFATRQPELVAEILNRSN